MLILIIGVIYIFPKIFSIVTHKIFFDYILDLKNHI
mgnify:CR=1 FL=1